MNTLPQSLPIAPPPDHTHRPVHRREHNQPGIRTWLMLIGGVVLFPLLALSVFLVLEVHATREAAIQRELAQRTESVANALHERLEAGIGALNALALSDAAMNDDLLALYAQAKRVAGIFPGVTGIGLIGPDLRMLFMTAKPFGSALAKPPNTAMSERVFSSGAPAVSPLFQGPYTGQTVVALGVPVYRKGEVDYCLVMIITSESLGDLLRAQSLPSEWVGAVVDHSGTIVARTASAEKFVGKPATPDMQSFIQAKRQGKLDSITKDGTPVVAHVLPVLPFQWQVAVGVPKELLAMPLRQSMVRLIGLALVIFAAGLIAASLAGKALERWIKRLLEAIHAIHAGSNCALHPSRIRELNAMARSLIDMSTRFRQIRSDLQHTENQRAQTAKALKQARIDGLTGLRVRNQFYEDVQARQFNLPEGEALALLFIDLDRFKAVNDRHGHQVGDQLLVQVGGILSRMAGNQHMAGRWGGDEFVLCVSAPLADIAHTTARLASQLELQVSAIGHGLGCSIGVAVWEENSDSLGDLIRRADVSMYQNKASR